MMPEASALFDHLNAGQCCRASHGRYCETGRELWVQDKVAFVLSISDRETRKVVMDTLRDNAPQWAKEIEDRIIRIWTEQRGNKMKTGRPPIFEKNAARKNRPHYGWNISTWQSVAHDHQVNGRRPGRIAKHHLQLGEGKRQKMGHAAKMQLEVYGFEWRPRHATPALRIASCESALNWLKVAGLSLPDTVYRGYADCD